MYTVKNGSENRPLSEPIKRKGHPKNREPSPIFRTSVEKQTTFPIFAVLKSTFNERRKADDYSDVWNFKIRFTEYA